jgi:hypothetical protein
VTRTSLRAPDPRRDGPPTTLWVIAGAVASAATVLLIGVVGERFASSASVARGPAALETSMPTATATPTPTATATPTGAPTSTPTSAATATPPSRTSPPLASAVRPSSRRAPRPPAAGTPSSQDAR